MAVLKVKYQESIEFPEGKYHDPNVYQSVLQYILNPEKVYCAKRYGVSTNAPWREMEQITHAYGKVSGIHLRHWILSFSPKEVAEGRNICYDRIMQIADYAAGYYLQDYQLVYAIHMCSSNPHVHFVLNTTSWKTGQKYRGDKHDYFAYQRYLADFLRDNYGIALRIEKDS